MTYPTTALIQMPIGDYETHIERERNEAAASANAEANTLREQLKQAMADNETLTRENTAQRTTISDVEKERDIIKERMNTIDAHYEALARDADAIDALLKISPLDDRVKYVRELIAENARLKAAQLPPLDDTGVVVFDPDPVTTKPVKQVFPFAGVYIEDERAVDNVAQAQGRAAAMVPVMEFAADSALTDYIIFANQYDIQHGELMRTMRRLNKRWWQSPIQIYFNEPDRFKAHLKRLYDNGLYGCFIDDAQNLTPDMMNEMLDQINEFIPGAPVVCSFAATFDDSAYPKSRYIDSRQWFYREQELPSNWFPKWEQAQDAQIYTADVWKRGGGYMHTPEQVQKAFDVALPFVQGIAWYSLYNNGKWNHVKDHQEAIAKDKDARTIWTAMRDCSAIYAAKFEAAR